MVTGGSSSDLGRMPSFLAQDATAASRASDVGDSLSEFLGVIKCIVLCPHKFVGANVLFVPTIPTQPPFPPPLPLRVDEGAPIMVPKATYETQTISVPKQTIETRTGYQQVPCIKKEMFQSPLLFLRTLARLHEDLLQNYECTDQPAPPPPSAGGGAAANAGAHPQPQHAGSQDDGNGKLVLPQLNRLHEAFKRNQIPSSASSSSQAQQPNRPTPIPTQRRLTQQLTKHWGPFTALRQRYADTRFDEQRQLHLPKKHKATVQDSTLRVEMNALQEQADNAKPASSSGSPLMSWLETIRPKSANDAFDPALWATFVSMTLGVGVPR
jgi:hypothetical protein